MTAKSVGPVRWYTPQEAAHRRALIEELRTRPDLPQDDREAALRIVLEGWAELAEPIPGSEADDPFGLPRYACPLCGSTGSLFIGYARTGLRRHLERGEMRATPCRVTEGIFQELEDAEIERERELRIASAERMRHYEARTGFCYLIRCAATGRLKIGKARDPKLRMADLQRGTGADLELLATIKGPDGYAIEAKMHERFAAYRVRGEWFEPHPDIFAAFGIPA